MAMISADVIDSTVVSILNSFFFVAHIDRHLFVIKKKMYIANRTLIAIRPMEQWSLFQFEYVNENQQCNYRF